MCWPKGSPGRCQHFRVTYSSGGGAKNVAGVLDGARTGCMLRRRTAAIPRADGGRHSRETFSRCMKRGARSPMPANRFRPQVRRQGRGLAGGRPGPAQAAGTSRFSSPRRERRSARSTIKSGMPGPGTTAGGLYAQSSFKGPPGEALRAVNPRRIMAERLPR